VADALRSVHDAEVSLDSSGATLAPDSLFGVPLERAWDGHAADVQANRSLVAARRRLTINTYTETAPNPGEFLTPILSLQTIPTLTFGPSESDVAVLSR